MANKKPSFNAKQHSLFDVYVEQIQSLDQENKKENDRLEELLYGSRQTDRTLGNSNKRAYNGNNQSRSQNRGAQAQSLFDFGQVGAEQSRETSGTRANGDTERDRPSVSTVGDRGQSDGFGGVLRHGDGRPEQVGNLQNNGREHGTLTDYPPIANAFAPKPPLVRENKPIVSKNYKITEADNLGKGGAKAKFQDNIEAIKTLNRLNRRKAEFATDGEQKILAKYVGWGGLPQAFDKENTAWVKEFDELQGVLSSKDYDMARRSTQDAHFTPSIVIDGMYRGLARIGVNQADNLKILEPSAGIGHFIGLKPETFKADFYTVEQDPISAKILEYLYPHEHNLKASYQEVDFGKNIFDVTIGNPPFGNQKLFDKANPQLSDFSIHNYFIAKSMDCVKEGGVGAFVVSRYFMDAHNGQHRDYIAENSHFLGAVRLPHTAFKENALTDVTTDIVFLQKKTALEKEQGITRGHDMTHLGQQYVFDQQSQANKPAYFNKYFIDHPEQILGKMEYTSGQFGEELKCVPPEKQVLDMSIVNALQALPRGIFDKSITQENKAVSVSSEVNTDFVQGQYFQSLKLGSFLVNPVSRNIGVKATDDFLQDIIQEYPTKNLNASIRIKSMIEIRDALRKQIELEKSNASDEAIEQQRKELNLKYDSFVKKFGHLNSQTNRSLFRDDPEASLVQALETKFDKGISKEVAKKTGKEHRPPSAVKAAIFSKRVLEHVQPASSAENALDALSISLRERGRIDFDRMGSLLKRSAEEVQAELQRSEFIFKNPQNSEWEIKDKYLTGNVKAKLKLAEASAQENPEYQSNVDALKAVIPKDIEAVDIGVKFGSTWLPKEALNDFLDEKIGGVSKYNRKLDYIPVLGKWDVKLSIYDYTINNSKWGTPEYPAEELIKSILTNRPIKVEKEVGRDANNKPITKIDQEATDVALQKAEEIQQAFSDWIWQDDGRREELTRIYNDKFNTHVTPHYDGSHVELMGASSDIKLRKHQKDAVWRSIQEGTSLFDHVVGAGKTLAAVATIKESKRMGFNKKPMVVVPNHLVYQWRDEFYRLYPDANILVAEKSDFLKENRERFFSKVATGNWDAVIVAHSSFKKIDMPKDVQREILEEQIEAVTDAIDNSKANGNRSTVKQLEKQKERMQERFKKLLEGESKDKSVDFSDLGVDALFVDEAHEFKNLSFSTSMNVSGLGNTAGSAKALDLFVKCRYLQRQNEGKGVYFLTGTPISNTIAEVYTMQRYMQYDELKEKNIDYFDAWASTFGKVTSKWELDATGVNYKLKERFANFENVPELLSMYRTFADVVTKADIDEQLQKENKRPLTPPIKNGKPNNITVERSEEQARYMDEIIDRMEHLPSDPSKDNPLKITNDARKAGLDFRLIDPTAPDFEGSKVNVCANRIYELWQEHREDKGTQLVFCDLSTPKGNSQSIKAEKAVDIPQDNEFGDVEKDEAEQLAEQLIDMDEVLAGLAGNGFSVYDDLKRKLVAKGIPSEEVAFIHDANTDIKKGKLFDDVNRGDVRVLIGSTSKMGAGMNCQRLLVAAHHLDAPWRPSDVSQRDGRIVRQGNSLYEKNPNFEVEINYYATKQTYDARLWQTIEYKAAAIEQFRKGDVLQRNIDDIQSEASNAAEMKAAASGNPLILQEVNLNTEKRKLEALFAQHNRSKHRLEDRLKYLQGADDRMQEAEKSYLENTQLRDKNTRKTLDDGKEKVKVELIVDGVLRLTSNDEEELKSRFVESAKEAMMYRHKKVDFGNYRGFDVTVRFTPTGGKDGFRFVLGNDKGAEFFADNLVYACDDKLSIMGLFQRMDNYLEKNFDTKLAHEKFTYQREKEEISNIKEEISKGFAQDDELKLTRENHSAVLRELKRMQEDTTYVSEWKPKTLEAFRAEKVVEEKHVDIVETVKIEKASTIEISM